MNSTPVRSEEAAADDGRKNDRKKARPNKQQQPITGFAVDADGRAIPLRRVPAWTLHQGERNYCYIPTTD